MNNGMTFGMDGPMITGWWVNPKTGDKFNAVDTFFEDNNLLVKSSDGRILNYNQLQNYIQTDKPDDIVQQVKSSQNKSVVRDEIPTNILSELEQPGEENKENLIIPDDDIWGNPKQSIDISIPASKLLSGARLETGIKDFDIIDRALTDKPKPFIEGQVNWKGYPETEIRMICDIMKVSPESIIDYYINQISIDDIANSIKESLREFIEKKSNPTKTNSDEPTKKTTKKK